MVGGGIIYGPYTQAHLYGASHDDRFLQLLADRHRNDQVAVLIILMPNRH